MVYDAWLLLLLPLETRKVGPDNPVVLTLKPGNQTSPHLTQLIIVVLTAAVIGEFSGEGGTVTLIFLLSALACSSSSAVKLGHAFCFSCVRKRLMTSNSWSP